MKSNTVLLQELNEVRTIRKTGFVNMEEFLEFIRKKNERKAEIIKELELNINVQNN